MNETKLLVLLVILCVGSHAFNRHQPYVYFHQDTPTSLGRDTAVVSVLAKNISLQLWGQTGNCYHCSKQLLWQSGNNRSIYLDTNWPFDFEVISSNGISLLNFSYQFGEHGQYALHIVRNASSIHQIIGIEVEPDLYWLPILMSAVMFISLCIFWTVGNWGYAKWKDLQHQKKKEN